MNESIIAVNPKNNQVCRLIQTEYYTPRKLHEMQLSEHDVYYCTSKFGTDNFGLILTDNQVKKLEPFLRGTAA